MYRTFQEARQALAGQRPGDPLTMSIEDARRQQSLYFRALNGRIPEVARSDSHVVQGPHGDIPVRLVSAHRQQKAPCVVFLRGAGFWAGGIDSHLGTIHRLAVLTGCVLAAIDYRRTPEYRYPAQQEEILCVLAWLRRRGAALGLQQDAWVLFGESAGATLALSAALALRDRGAAMPAGLVLFYPNCGGPKTGARPYSRWVWQSYLGNADPQAVPGPVPLLQDLRGLPPMWLGCGTEDPLLADTRDLAGRLEQAGVPRQLALFPAMPHAFVMHAATLQPARLALEQAAQAIRHMFDSSSTETRPS
ncbi:alpha/beta hydrolase fold domain-containing protein [Pigmentiphaga soli]|uniref:Alpha/beta hydrolase fold domain-containing protein n=1 Tax=Pigmentiphaga soli TaxID=1007095 RepID=A0ABP8HNK6_9BURK